ncbi:hypothetical protein JOF53_005311 [Crossiella equi]|uniref:Uncharacterized protein n=1 Tax=Crossiella equi TaxID=130796 RepID=A0ABS5AJQ0_9PSEU|nr:hypothetical protein [Crossiella equi]MBP2476439.1 hypothetical protein [Crossiella equi]
MTEVEELPVEQVVAREPLSGRAGRALVLLVLIADAVLLAWLELIFLPLRVSDLWAAVPPAYNWPLPVTILLAGAATPWLILAAAKCTSRMILISLPFLAWLGASIVFGVAGPGGDVLLTDDWRALAFLAVGSLSGAVALGTRLSFPHPADARFSGQISR